MKTSTKNLVIDPIARREAARLVLKCGIHANLKGFSRLIDAVIIYGATSCSLSELYRTIADNRALKPKTVIREISYAISSSTGLKKHLSDMIGSDFCSAEIHNGLVIAALATVLDSKLTAHTV